MNESGIGKRILRRGCPQGNGKNAPQRQETQVKTPTPRKSQPHKYFNACRAASATCSFGCVASFSSGFCISRFPLLDIAIATFRKKPAYFERHTAEFLK